MRGQSALYVSEPGAGLTRVRVRVRVEVGLHSNIPTFSPQDEAQQSELSVLFSGTKTPSYMYHRSVIKDEFNPKEIHKSEALTAEYQGWVLSASLISRFSLGISSSDSSPRRTPRLQPLEAPSFDLLLMLEVTKRDEKRPSRVL